MARTKVSASGKRTTKLSSSSKKRLQSQLDQASSAVASLQSAVANRTSGGGSRPPAARGDDFAGGFGEEGLGIVDRTGGSINDAIDVGAGRTTESAVSSRARQAQRERERQLQAEIRKRRKDARKTRLADGRLATDNLRASATNLTQDEAITTQGARSSRVLTDEEIDEYASRGFTEGDVVPDEGRITPYGTFDRTPIEQQATLDKAREEAMRIQEQLNKMRSRETADEFTGVVTDEPVVRQEQAAIDRINAPNNIISGALELLQQQEDIIQRQLDAEIKAAKQSYEAARSDAEGRQEREVGQTSVGLANAGGYLGFSGSGTGVMLTLTRSHRAEIDRIKLERDRAISEARAAAANKQYDAVREQAQLVERLENEAYERQVAYQEEMQAAADAQAEEAQRRQTENQIFNLIQSGVRSPQDIYAQLGGAVSIADVNKMLTGFLPDGLKSGGGFKFTATNIASLLGSGLSQDDILALNEYVNDNGYDEKVRSSLTASQRAVADKIFRTTTGTSGGSLSKPMGVLDLDRIEESYGVRFPYGVTQGEVTQFFEDNAGASPEEMQAALDAELNSGLGDNEDDDTIDLDFINNEMTDAQKKKLADKVGASRWYTPRGMDIERLLADPQYLEAIKDLSEADLLEIFSQ